MDWLHRVVDRPGRALAWFGGIVTLLMMAHISADVIAREVFESPINGTLEITASFYMVALVFLPLAHVTLGEGHIVVELFTRNLTAPALRRLDGWIALLGLAYVGLMAVSDPRVTPAFLRRSLVALAAFAAHAILSIVVLVFLVPQDIAPWGLGVALIGWLGLGLLTLLRHAPEAETRSDLIRRFGLLDIGCLALIAIGIAAATGLI